MDTVASTHATDVDTLFSGYQEAYTQHRSTTMGIREYLDACQTDPTMYASPQERLLKAIGKPELVNTREVPRLSRIFQNRVIKIYPAFAEFYGIETVIENIVSFLVRAAQGLEEAKQILYLLGPVGGGKSSLADRLKELMEQEPFYALKDSPIFESPLGLFSPQHQRQTITEKFGIDARHIPRIMSPWAAKRLEEYGGDITQFEVVQMYPSILDSIAIAKTEPGDENNQDISSLVGKVDIRQLETLAQNDPDAYRFSGGLSRGNQGLLEFVEMFKAPIKTLNPLLTATQEGNYNGTEAIGAIPFRGMVLAHSNESEWEQFCHDKRNEAFIDRVHTVKVPYCLRVDEEEQIYQKLIRKSALADAPCAPDTLHMMAKMSVLTRIKDPGETSTWRSKMRTYNGEDLKDLDPKARQIHAYTDEAGVTEGMNGLSTRFAFKVISKTFNYDPEEIAANPVHLLFILEEEIKQAQFPEAVEEQLIAEFLKGVLSADYKEFIGKEIQAAYVESYAAFGQNIYDRYIRYADHWLQGIDFRDPDTGTMLNRKDLNDELEKTEKPAGITNPKDFRNETVNYSLRYRAEHGNQNPSWRSYQKMREVIEQRIFARTEDLLPVISFGEKESSEIEDKHQGFVNRMKAKGYTYQQVRLLVDWFERVQKND